MAISQGYSPWGRAGTGKTWGGTVAGKPSTSGRGRANTFGAARGGGKSRPGGGTGGRGGKSPSYAIPSNKLR